VRVTVTTLVVSANTTSGAIIDGGRPRSHEAELSFPFQTLAARLSGVGWVGRQDPGTQNVNPEARSWRQDESTDPTSETAHGTTATGTVGGAGWVHATPSAGSNVNDRRVCRICPPNGDRRLTNCA